MIDPLLNQMVKTVAILKTESECAFSAESLSRIERLASLLYVQAAQARASLQSPQQPDAWVNAYAQQARGRLLN